MNQDRSSKITKTSRVDQVGSLLRPSTLKDAYARHGDGEIGDGELTRVQEESVKELIAKQEAHGLSILTDGEFRRLNFQDSFVESVSGFISKKQTMQFQESHTVGGEALQRWVPDSQKTNPALQYWRPISERLRLARNVPLQEWRSASALTSKPVKVTLIATDRICENFQRQNTHGVYADDNEYRADVIAVEREIVSQLAQAGCPYIQHDAPSYTAYVDAKSLAGRRLRAAALCTKE
jgi:5-methyltetrahydropteroyltriglutamate--homocysteine methyltransferase